MKSALSASILISLALLLGRISGFVRETLLAGRLGTSAEADAAILILTLPDFMVGLLLAGGFSAALVPVLKQHKGADRIFLLHRTTVMVSLGFVLLSLLIGVFAKPVIQLFIPRVDFAALPQFIAGFNMSLVALPVAALIGVSTSSLNTVGRFTIPSLSVLIFNGAICTYLALPFVDPTQLLGFAAVVLLAAVLRLLFQLRAMPEAFCRPHGSSPPWPTGLLRKFFVGTLGYSVIVGAAIVFRSLHALNGEGYMAVFNFAQKLFELPAALLIAPVVIVMLPTLSALDPADKATFEDYTRKALLAGLTLACVAASAGWLFMPTIVQLIYEHGAMTPAESALITQAARVMVAALPLYALLQLSATALNAQGRPTLMMTNSFIALGVGVAFHGALALLGWGENAAAAGFVMFHVVAAVLCLAGIFGWGLPSAATVRVVLLMLAKMALALAPFVYLSLVRPDMPTWLGFCALTAAGVLLTAVNLSLIKPLIMMKIDRS
jgi:putative peptidoglycan lipid II flippase